MIHVFCYINKDFFYLLSGSNSGKTVPVSSSVASSHSRSNVSSVAPPTPSGRVSNAREPKPVDQLIELPQVSFPRGKATKSKWINLCNKFI